MANGFDPTDPTQLTASPETSANAPIPMDELNKTQPDPNDPNVMFSEAALQRDKDFRDVDTYTELGLSAQDIVSVMGSDEGRSSQEIAGVISSKYEIEQAEIRLENEKYKAEFEENKRNSEKRQQDLKDLRLKKKVLPSEPDGEFLEPGLDGSEPKEAVASPELATEYAAIEGDPRFSGYTNYYDAVEGVDSPEMIRLAGVNASLANDASMQFYSDELLESLSDGDMATAKEMFEALESMGAKVPESLKKETGFIGGGIETVSDYFGDRYRGKDDEVLKTELLTWGQGQKEKYKSDAVMHMTELKGAYENLGIDYDLNPESDLDMRQAILESYDLDEGLSMTTEAYKISERAKDIGGRQMSWLEQRTVGLQGAVSQFANMGLNLGGVLERLSGNEMEAEAKFRAAGYVDEVMAERAKTKREQMGIKENVQAMGLGESWRADDVSVGQSMLKTLDFAGTILPDVVFAITTMGRGAAVRAAAKEAAESASKAVIGSAVKSAITKNLRREARAAGRKAFRAAGGRAGTILKVGPSVLFGGRSAASTYQSVWDRPDMSEGDKLFLSSVVGVAEGALTYVFSGAEAAGASATRAWLTKAGGREGINKATQEALKGLTKKQIWFQGAKDTGGEWLEEAMIETIDQSTRNLIEWSNGREVKPIDWLAIEDAGLGGLLGSGPMGVVGAASRSYSHSKVSNLKVKLISDLNNIDNQILVTTDPSQIEVLKRSKKSLLDNIASLNTESQTEFDKLTDSEKQAVGSLAREMETLKAEINVAKDNNDTDTSKILEKQFEQKFELKKQIEETASTREPVVSNVVAADSKGNDVSATAQDVTPEKKSEVDAMPEADAEQVSNDSDTSETIEESKANKKLTSALTSLDKYLGLTSSDPENSTKHKRIAKAQRTRAINLKAELKGGTVEAKAEATAEVDAYIEAKNLIRQAEAGAAAAVNEQGTAKLQAAKDLIKETEQGSPEAAEETASQEAAPDLEDSSVTIEAGQDVDINADWVGDGEGKISLTVVLQVQRLKKAFNKVLDKYGVKIQMHTTLDSFKKATGVDSYGMYVPGTKTIHISPKSTKSDVQEEFGHAVFRTLMSNNSKLRQEIYQELSVMNKLIRFTPDGKVDTTEWVSSATRNEDGSVAQLNFVSPEKQAEVNSNPILKAFIEDSFLYEGKPISEIQEETIMSVLTAYAENSDFFTDTQKGEGFINRLIRQFNRVMKIGGYKGNYISSQDSFFSMAAKFKSATTGVETTVETISEDYAGDTTTEQAVAPAPATPRPDAARPAQPTPPPAPTPPTPPTPTAPVVSDTAIDPKNVVQYNSNDKPGAAAVEQGSRTSPSLRGKNINDLIGKKFTFEITPSHEVLREDMGEKKFVEVMVQDLPGTKWGVGFTVLKADYLGGEYKSVNNNEAFSAFINKLNDGHTRDAGMGGIIPQDISSAINALQKRDPNSWDYGKKQGTGKETFAPSKALSNLNSGPAGMLIKLVEADSKGMESRKFAPRPNLNNAEVFYTQTLFRTNKSGVSSVSSVRERSIKVNDYWHFYNLYAKMTGNGMDAKRMENMYYVKDGVKYPSLEAPSPKKDRATGELLKINIPYMKTYQQFQGDQRRQESELSSTMSQEFAELTREVSELFRSSDKKLEVYTQERDFQPTSDIEVGFEGVDALSKQLESLVIAKKNIQAFIDSDITAEDLEAIAGGRGRTVDKNTNPEIFNMSGLTPFSEAQEGEAFGEDTLPNTKGLESRKFEVDSRLSSLITENRGDLIKDIGGYKARLFGYDRTKKGSGVRALINKVIRYGNKKDGYRDATVITAHRDVEIADIVMADLSKTIQQEIADGNYDQETGIGYIATMEALLKDESTLGNPDAFKRLINKYGSKETFERSLNGRNKEGELTNSSKEIRREIRIGAQKINYEGREIVQAVISDNDVVLTEDQVVKIKKVLQPGKAVDKKSFKKRTLIAKRMLSKEQKNELYKFENDSAWSNVNTAEVVAYTKIPFKVDPSNPRGFTGFEVANEENAAFEGLIIEDGTIEEKPQIKIVNELYSIPELFPGMKILKLPTGEDVDIPMSELSAEDQMKQASTLAGISQIRGTVVTEAEYNAANDTEQYTSDKKTVKQESRKFESRGGMTEAQTDSGPFQLREKTWFQEWKGKWLRRLADKYRDVLLIQEDIETSKGSAVKESQDFKMAEERMYGKAANDLQKLEEKTKEMTSMMKEMGLTQGAVSDYMYALHAKERNALIEERDGVENGSGMTDAEADSLLEEIALGKEGEFTEDWLEGGINASTQANLDKVVDIIREIQQDTRKAMVKFGLESQETIDVFEAQFKNYVPLAGIAKDEADSGNTRYPTGGAGMSVQGDSYKKAKGRQSQAANLMAQVISQNASVHIAGRTNEALQSLHELVTENPNSKVWTIVDTASYGDAHVVPVRINGEQKYIRFADSSYAETLKGMSVPRTGALVKLLRAPANWLRRSFTTLNPEFVISNFSRDIQSAIFNAMAEADIEGGALLGKSAVKDIIKMVGPSLKTLVKGVAGKSGDPMIEKYYADFQEDGGKTGWAYAKNLEDIAADIEKETTEQSTAQKILGKAEAFAGAIEGVNDAFENSIRLASYIGARENGVSRGKAAQLAKNITVNFNKHGEYGQALNAVYLFFNASIQGTTRLGKSLLTMKPPVKPNGVKAEWYERINGAQKMAAGLTVFSSMLTMIGRAMSGEDEDGVLFYDKIPDYVKERNLIFMFDGENYIKVPMPYGFNIFANLGTAAVETAEGVKEPEEAMMFLANSFMGAFSPVSFGQSKDLFTSVGKSATPTVLKPLVEIMTNETYFGGPVYAAQSPYASPKPESSMSFRSPGAVQDFFEWMNKTTGGSKHVPGNVDMNPDKFWHVFDYFLGGAGQFVSRTGETVFKVGNKLTVDNDVKVEFNDIPLMRKMYGEPSKYYDFEKFKERETEIKQLVREYKQNRSEDLSRYKGLGPLNNKLKVINKSLKVIRSRKREARDIENYAERSIRMQELMDKERSLIMDFNKVYDKLKDNE